MFSRLVKMIVLGIVALVSSSQLYAGNLRCAPLILSHAVQAFEIAKAKGLVALDLDGREVSLGSDIDVRSLEVQDISKDSYKVRFNLNYIDNASTNKILQSTIYAVNYETCSIYQDKEQQLNNPVYRLIN